MARPYCQIKSKLLQLKHKEDLSLKDVFTQIHELVASLAGSVVLFSVFAYCIGWLWAKSYYSEIGASWYVSLLSPLDILSYGVPYDFVILFAFLFGLVFLMTKSWGMGHLGLLSIIFGCLIIVAAIVKAFVHFRDPESILTYQRLLTGSTLAFYGFQFAFLIGQYQIEKPAYYGTVLSTFIVTCVFVGLNISESGVVNATDDFNQATSKLSYAIRDGCSTCIYRVVHITNGKVLLAQISTEKSNRKFFYMPLDEKIIIRPALP